MKRAEAAREKLVGDVVRENKRLAEPLSQVGSPTASWAVGWWGRAVPRCAGKGQAELAW